MNDLRTASVETIQKEFEKVDVDNSGGKAIALSGGSLTRKIDIIICAWWETKDFRANNQKRDKGIYIWDTKAQTPVRNKPFLHNYNIDKKDRETGSLRKAIRLLKSLKYDAESELKISSYDIAALAYNLTHSQLCVPPGNYLQLAENILQGLDNFVSDGALRESLLVPNGTRRIFGDGGATLEALNSLNGELRELLSSISAQRVLARRSVTENFRVNNSHRWYEVQPSILSGKAF